MKSHKAVAATTDRPDLIDKEELRRRLGLPSVRMGGDPHEEKENSLSVSDTASSAFRGNTSSRPFRGWNIVQPANNRRPKSMAPKAQILTLEAQGFIMGPNASGKSVISGANLVPKSANISDHFEPLSDFMGESNFLQKSPATHLIMRFQSKVPRRGLEPLLLSEPDPKSGASANFATSATCSS